MQGFLPPLPWHEPEKEDLTNRENEVLITIAEGLSAKEAAFKLHIALATVRAHKASIYSKLDLHSVPAVLNYAIRKGLVQLRYLDHRSATTVSDIHCPPKPLE